MPVQEENPLVGLFDDASPEAVEMKEILQQLAKEVLAKGYGVIKVNELPTYQVVRAKDVAYQGRLVLALATAMQECLRRGDYRTRYSLGEVLTGLMRSTLALNENEYLRLFKLYGIDFDNPSCEAREMVFWGSPMVLTLANLAKLSKGQGLSEKMQGFLQQLIAYGSGVKYASKSIIKIQEILSQHAGFGALPVIAFAGGDSFGRYLNQFVQQLPSGTAGPWLTLLQLWQKTSGAQPSVKYRKELAAAVALIGPENVGDKAKEMLRVLVGIPVEAQPRVVDYGNGQTYEYTEYAYVQEPNLNVAKGIIWTVPLLADEELLPQLADLAVKCYRKVPGRGPLAAGLGNACLLALANSGLPGVSCLSRVRPKIKQANTQSLIAGHIETASQALGVSPAEIEDMAVPDFGLQQGRCRQELGEYAATLLLVNGKAEVQWEKAGKVLKAAPAALKATHAAELKELKNNQTQLQQTFTAQRERLDRGFVEGRQIPLEWFQRYYFGHGLMAQLTRPLIWRFHHASGSHTDALWLDNAWHDAQQQPIAPPASTDTVQLWHPVLADPAAVLAWRRLLDKQQIRQPLKQVYREVYLLTPPEERTATYSNRMAAHILKQHQFNSLAKLRGWRYSLLGAYDKGYESDKATLELPAHHLRVEFWVSEVNADDAWNDTGIYLYVSTDQVCFRHSGSGDVQPLPGIPPLVFSEVMRDVDLFVGVASVGNDPLWRDNGGLVQYRNYWESYSFGELGEVAKNRKLALERLVPRLKIGKVSEIKDRFLVVRGKLRTYKIHLGSGNILMEPNDQYLCIVPDRSAKSAGATDVFLPFEGDAVLSIILSKALLLMDDDKITDETINRQIKS